jgi:two-component system sensor histidine kinase ResE
VSGRLSGRIVDHLLVLCRLDAGEQAAPNELVDLGQLAAGAAEQMRLLFVEKDLQLKLRVAPNVVVSGVPVRLKQVIVNLLDNAIKYSSTGGTIELAVAETGSHACLEVADNGSGISPQALPHLFERFYRADKARSRGSGGVGLGLSIVQAIAASHGGSVNVESAEGRGTHVRFALPLAAGLARLRGESGCGSHKVGRPWTARDVSLAEAEPGASARARWKRFRRRSALLFDVRLPTSSICDSAGFG